MLEKRTRAANDNTNGTITHVECAHCGAADKHTTCPVCDGRGCISPRELSEKLNLRDHLDMTEMSAEAIAKAVDAKVVDCIKQAQKTERELAQKTFENERARAAEAEQRTQDLLRQQKDELAKMRQSFTEAEQRAKLAEEQLAKRRQQPAAVGRVAERDFAALIGAQNDFRVSPKLVKGGDYEVWFKVEMGDGTDREIAEPVLVDVKKESAALNTTAFPKLVRDCRARGRSVGVLVADRMEEVSEIFGHQRIRVDGDTTVLLTSVDAFCADMRLLRVYLKAVIEAQVSGNRPLVAALGNVLTEVSQVLGEIADEADGVAGVLVKQADTLRKTVVGKLCARVNQVVATAHKRITDAATKAKATQYAAQG